MAQQKFQQQPVPILEWHYADDTLPIATDSTSQNIPTDRRQDRTTNTDKQLTLADNGTPTSYTDTQPTSRQANRPTTTVVFTLDDTVQKVIRISARSIVVVVVVGGAVVGIAYILIEVVAALAALATEAAILFAALAKIVMWVVAAVAAVYVAWQLFFAPNDTPPTRQGNNSNNNEGGSIIVNIHSNNGNQKIN